MGLGGPSSPMFAAAGSFCLEGTGLPAFPNSSDVWPRFRFLPDAVILANCFAGVEELWTDQGCVPIHHERNVSSVLRRSAQINPCLQPL
jgi:hypothetical protein